LKCRLKRFRRHFCVTNYFAVSISSADDLQQIRIWQMFQAERKHDKNNKASEQSEALLSN
ncbi:hypothetical protein EST47_26925, partial [Escherichia coli]|nr:hypothetical protein [Escherichia coli]